MPKYIIEKTVCVAILLTSFSSLSGQVPIDGKPASKWEATQIFPNVAVAKVSETSSAGTLHLLIPRNDFTTEHVEQAYSVTVPYTEETSNGPVTKYRIENRTRAMAVQRCGEMKMRRTMSDLKTRTIMNLAGQRQNAEDIKSLANPVHVIYGPKPDEYIRSVLNPNVLVVEPIDGESSDENSTALTREKLKDPWFREEKNPIVAVAKVSNDGKLLIMLPKVDYKADFKNKGNPQPVISMGKHEIELNECVFQDLQHKSLTSDQVTKLLTGPTHVLWESEVGEFLSRVLRPDVLVVNLKEGSHYSYDPVKSLTRLESTDSAVRSSASSPSANVNVGPETTSTATADPKRNVATAAVEQLRKRMSEAPIDVGETSNLKLVDYLSCLDIPVHLAKHKLSESGLSIDLKLTANSDAATLAEQLDALLLPANLSWYLRGTVLVVTTLDDTFDNCETCLYPVPASARDYSRLISQLETIEPRHWGSNGGQGAALPLPPYLVVRQAAHVQRKIETTLKTAPLPHKYNTDLDECLVSVDANSTPLSKVLSQLSTQIDKKILIDESNLETLGIVDPPITFAIKNISAYDALDLILDPLDCTWIQQARDIKVVGNDAARNALEQQVLQLPNLRFVDNGSVLNVIHQTVAPNSWQASGGKGRISMSGRRLNVSQGQPAIREMQRFLADLATSR